MQAAMLCAKAALDQLQQQAHGLRASGPDDQQRTKRTLHALLQLSHALHKALVQHWRHLQQHQGQADDQEQEQRAAAALRTAATRAAAALADEPSRDALVEQLQQRPAQLAAQVQQALDEQLAHELRQVEQTLALRAGGGAADARALEQLQQAVRLLRAAERDVRVQAE